MSEIYEYLEIEKKISLDRYRYRWAVICYCSGKLLRVLWIFHRLSGEYAGVKNCRER